jgi:AcrR family transcriptional regulator
VEPQNGGPAKGPLSRDLICRTAIEVIDEVGLDAVSMRMLAGALGVKASSLYYHFGSKEELLAGVAEFLYGELGQVPSAEDWADQVKGTFLQLRDFIRVHPHAAPLLLRDLARSSIPRQRTEVQLRLARRAGMSTETTAHLLSNLVALLVGHSLLELWADEESDDRADGSDGAEREGELDDDFAFTLGLDALIRGFAPRQGRSLQLDPVHSVARPR